MAKTLSLYWNLSSPAKQERIDASVKLIEALQEFQDSHVSSLADPKTFENGVPSLGSLNADDVVYALRRLVRGLASPRESSRQGFAVVLTELLSRLHTITSGQVIDLIISSSELKGSLSGQEERDMMFSRLFGLTAVINSTLIIKEDSLPQADTPASTLQDYQRLVTELITLGERKLWIRESCWWSVMQAISLLSTSTISFKAQALDWSLDRLFIQDPEWTPEKVGIWLKFQALWGSKADTPLTPVFRGKHLLTSKNLSHLSKILRDADFEEEEEGIQLKKQSSGSWKPTPHFVWDILFDYYFPSGEDQAETAKSSFHEFFRIVIDESFFSTSASAERKYTGFQLVELALKKAPSNVIPQLFTRNFLRTWINQLSNHDRYLHKIALKLAGSLQELVQKSPSIGLPLIAQLLGPNGNRDFDRVSKTKTVEIILGKMEVSQITEYVKSLIDSITEVSESENDEVNQQWTLGQLSSLIKSAIIPKDDLWVGYLLNFLVRNGFFIHKADAKHKTVELSETIKSACRDRFFSSLADLSNQVATTKHDTKSSKFKGRTNDGQFWVESTAKTFRKMEKDKKLRAIFSTDKDAAEARSDAWSTIKLLKNVDESRKETADGVLLLLSANILRSFKPEVEEADGNALDILKECTKTLVELFKDSSEQMEEAHDPIDLLLDELIGYLEKGDQLMRIISPQVFSSVCSELQESGIDFLLEQLKPRSVLPDESSGEEEEEEEGIESESSQASDTSGESSNDNEDEDASEEDEAEGDVDKELRRKIAAALGENMSEEDSDSISDTPSDLQMDDDQMMQLDEKLADIFKAHSSTNKGKIATGLQREATHFKIRVLDFIDIFVRKNPRSKQIPRLILPLIRVIMGASPEEQQLAEKTSGIIRQRIGSLKVFPEKMDVDALKEDLEDLHNIARKASHQQIVPSTVSSSNVYLSKVLVHDKHLDAVVTIHHKSLTDFLNRKGSKINHVFFTDFIKRLPAAAWLLREDLITAAGSEHPIHAFRQTQAITWTDMLLQQVLQVPDVKTDDVQKTMQSIREITYRSIQAAIDKTNPTSVAQAKALVKVAMHAISVTKRMTPQWLSQIWNIPQLKELLKMIQSSAKLSETGNLKVLMSQMAAKLADSGNEKDSTQNKGNKRKVAKDFAIEESPKKKKKSKV